MYTYYQPLLINRDIEFIAHDGNMILNDHQEFILDNILIIFQQHTLTIFSETPIVLEHAIVLSILFYKHGIEIKIINLTVWITQGKHP